MDRVSVLECMCPSEGRAFEMTIASYQGAAKPPVGRVFVRFARAFILVFHSLVYWRHRLLW
jgi:hypothetical protein